MNTPNLSPGMVLAAYAERLIEGRRVVVFGDSSSGLAEHLVDRGARLVHVYDSDPKRVALATARGAARNISFAPLGQTGIAARDGSFDVGIIDRLRSSDDPATLLKRLRRALAARGVALVGALNREASFQLFPQPDQETPGYYQLYDYVSAEFDEVRMFGQTPFVGYAVAEFNPESGDEFSVDTAFVPGGAEEPEYYVALASHFPIAADSFSVIQLPASAVLAETPRMVSAQALAERSAPPQAERALAAEARLSVVEQETRAAIAERDQLKLRLAEAEAKLSKAHAATEAQTAAAKQNEERRRNDERRARVQEDENKDRELLRQAQAELVKRDRWAEQLEERAATADARADAVQGDLEQAQAQLAQLRSSEQRIQAELKRAQQGLKQSQTEVGNLEAALAAANKELTEQARLHETQARNTSTRSSHEASELSIELQKLQKQVTDLLGQLERTKLDATKSAEQNRELAGEISALESQLRERGIEVTRLSVDLAKTENFAEQLIFELSDLKEAVPSLERAQPTVRAATSDEASANSRELEAQLEILSKSQARSQADLVAAQWTIAELEAKLRQQEAGAAPELAADLERAKAELQKQATLLHQLGSGQ